jgi:hypothetical protein
MEECGSFSADHLHLERIKGQKLDKPLILKIPAEYFWDHALNTWFDVSGAECSGTDQCEPAAHSKINILQLSRRFSIRWWRFRAVKVISGQFSIEFGDGRKLEGSFIAKIRKPVTQMICE